MHKGLFLAAVAFALGWLVGVDPLESLHADWDAKTKAYRRVPPADIAVQRDALAAARAANNDLQIASLDYWDPSDTAGVSALYREARSEGLIPYVATLALDHVVPEP